VYVLVGLRIREWAVELPAAQHAGCPYTFAMELSRAVVVEMVKHPVTGAASRWATFQWGIGLVLDDTGATDEREPVAEGGGEADDALRFSGLSVSLHASEGEGYWLNLTSPSPCLFVMWRQESGELPVPWVVTASYNEAGRMLDAGEKVENAPMSEPMRAWVQAFTDANYKPEVRKKVKRNDPFKDGAFRRERV
jgi:hypothetical protein